MLEGFLKYLKGFQIVFLIVSHIHDSSPLYHCAFEGENNKIGEKFVDKSYEIAFFSGTDVSVVCEPTKTISNVKIVISLKYLLKQNEKLHRKTWDTRDVFWDSRQEIPNCIKYLNFCPSMWDAGARAIKMFQHNRKFDSKSNKFHFSLTSTIFRELGSSNEEWSSRENHKNVL